MRRIEDHERIPLELTREQAKATEAALDNYLESDMEWLSYHLGFADAIEESRVAIAAQLRAHTGEGE